MFEEPFNRLATLCVIMPLLFSQCKEKEAPARSITLYNKPLPEIQAHIRGAWKLHYGKGGLSGNMKQYFENTVFEFSDIDRVKITTRGSNVYADTTITWIRDLGTFTNGDSTYVMKFYDKRTYPYFYIVNSIVEDTLVLHDAYVSDVMYYYFTK